jgi:hypothetical protein
MKDKCRLIPGKYYAISSSAKSLILVGEMIMHEILTFSM